MSTQWTHILMIRETNRHTTLLLLRYSPLSSRELIPFWRCSLSLHPRGSYVSSLRRSLTFTLEGVDSLPRYDLFLKGDDSLPRGIFVIKGLIPSLKHSTFEEPIPSSRCFHLQGTDSLLEVLYRFLFLEALTPSYPFEEPIPSSRHSLL